MKVSGTVGGLALVALMGCSAPADSLDESGTALSISPLGAAQPLWDAYVSEVASNPLQEGCKPVAAFPPAGAYKGVALLLHGYSACPEQFDELVPQLAASGFVVLSALLPGHGRPASRSADGKVLDDVTELPDEGHRSAYAAFAKRMALLVGAAPAGEHVVAGLSVGGVVAASATEQVPGVFDRVLLINPYFDASQPFTWAVPSLNGPLPSLRVAFPGCEDERSAGRRGFCQFEVTNLRAAQRFGNETLALAARIGSNTQVVGIEDDSAAMPRATGAAATAIQGAKACFFEAGIPHSILSRKENLSMPKYWLPALLGQARRFLATGQPFDALDKSRVASFPHCRSR